MSALIKQVSFSAGEVAPFLYARTDQALYEKGLRAMRNSIAMRHGGATRRPGTQYVGTTLNGGNQVRLIPFIFNETGVGQSYVLEFGNEYIAFYQNGGVVVSGGNPYTIATPYLQADLQSLQFDQTNDVVTITHQNYQPMELRRAGATNWTLTGITTQSAVPQVTGTRKVFTGGGSWTGVYLVTGFSSSGEESEPVAIQIVNAITAPSATNPIILQWFVDSFGDLTPIPPIYVYFKIYLQPNTNSLDTITSGGYVGTATGHTFTDTGFTPDFTNSPIQPNPLFNSAGNYPATVGYIQQRRGFANTINNPIGFWISRTGSYANFDFNAVPSDADAVIGTVAGTEVNSIQHLLELKFMLMLTTGAELYIQGNGSGVITPSEVNASVQSQYGASPLRPIKVADVVIFNQALGSYVRDLAFDFVIDGYRGNDLSVFSSHLFEGYQLVDWAYQKVPDSILWAVRNDGTLLGLTYVREQQILAWHRHDFTNGIVENVCAIPENGQYAVYLSIKRVINQQTVRYIERMSSRIWSDVLNATYLDCFSSYNGTNITVTTMTLLTPTGGFDQSGAAYQQKITLQSSASYFTAAMVGKQIFMNDAAFVQNIGNTVISESDGSALALPPTGNQVRCTIQAYINPTQVTVTPNRAVASTLQNAAVATWALAVNKLTGLNYLIGQSVAIWADRSVVASPNNPNVSFKATVQSDGTINLDKWYAVIYVGLPMTSDLETLNLDTSFGEAITGKRRRQNKLYCSLYNTRNFFAGSQNPDTNLDNITGNVLFQLDELKTGGARQTYDQPQTLITGEDDILEITDWNKNARVFIRTVDPTPMTILALAPNVDSPAPSPFYERL